MALHRGTAHHGTIPRPVIVVGVVAGVIAPGGGHELAMTKGYYTELPPAGRRNLRVTLVDELSRITQRHDIEGSMMG